ncbi:MAG: galactokinase [Bifidobacteriaceae bacterium]|jgi:galactokinase|nr:galactokinase [Bifidobacteriaceae bacterium]
MAADQLEFIEAWTPETGAARVLAGYADRFGGRPAGVWAAPGRVNIIGEHTDYNGGLAFPIALPHCTYVAVAPSGNEVIRLASAQADGLWQVAMPDVAPGAAAVAGWGSYVAGTVWALRRRGLAAPAVVGYVDSCVPFGAGLSSSAALECAFAAACRDLGEPGWADTLPARRVMVEACIEAENQIAGANTGGMDQSASLLAVAAHALLLDCRSGEARPVPFDLAAAGLELLVIDTRAPHQLNDGQYAARRATCEAAAQALGVATLREVPLSGLSAALDALAGLPDGPVAVKRVRHVVTEIDRTARFVDLLEAGRVLEVGPLLDASHESLRVDYEVTVPQLDVAVAAAREAGALGARMTGGGFGGSAIALIPAGAGRQVASAVAGAFAAEGFGAPAFLGAVPAGPARRVA